jgi:hypothetical protein
VRRRSKTARPKEQGVVILLVAVVLLFIVGAIAALAIDLVTFYTARSEAQVAADGAALAGARVLANSGMTSANDSTVTTNAQALATNIARQVAIHNDVGGTNLTSAEVTITYPNQGSADFDINPQIAVQIVRTTLPTFFAHIWGRSTVTVKASATAEAYNPSGKGGLLPPVAPSCLKPWILPNIDPTNPGNPIFNSGNGTIQNTALVSPTPYTGSLTAQCTTCAPPQIGTAWKYYPGSTADFPAPTTALPGCASGMTSYQKSIAGCVQQPMLCGSSSSINLSTFTVPVTVDIDTDSANAATCLTQHKVAGDSNGDTLDPPGTPPFVFIAGNDSPVTNSHGKDVLLSDSLVTVPVVDNFNSSPARVVGFVQLFLNPAGSAVASGVPATIINLAGCGNNASGQPIIGNGSGPVPVRLITP